MRFFLPYMFLLLAVSSGARGEAYRKTVYYGGLGLLYADTTSSTNPGQIALEKGSSISASLQSQGTDTLTGSTVTTVSETMAMGASYGQTSSQGISDKITFNTLTALAGVKAKRGKFTVGGSYTQNLNGSPNYTAFKLGFNYNGRPTGYRGQRFGFALTTTEAGINHTNSFVVAGGRSWAKNNAWELHFIANDIRDISDFSLGAFYIGKTEESYLFNFYFATGYTHAVKTSVGSFAARLGYVYHRVDIAATVSYPLFSNNTRPTYGGVLRLIF